MKQTYNKIVKAIKAIAKEDITKSVSLIESAMSDYDKVNNKNNK